MALVGSIEEADGLFVVLPEAEVLVYLKPMPDNRLNQEAYGPPSVAVAIMLRDSDAITFSVHGIVKLFRRRVAAL